MTTPPLKAVTLTHVRYQRGDQLGHFLAWVSLVPVFISLGGFVSHFIFRRELQGMFFALGLLISQFINEFIKTSVQQDRPETCALLETDRFWDSKNNVFLNFITWSLALLTMYSRVYLGYHTVAQVFAGATLGSFLGASWFWVVNSILIQYFPAIEESAFGRQFYIKDTSHIHNVLKFEYDNTRAARENRVSDSKSD
ncbi:hypothetical protein K1719_031735 [Acacia pycnantha]|nr:hypothetical protein K1719_031735 [Acacia pycnantha]